MSQKPARKTGVAHFFAAAGYSVGGARRLMRESAFRQEVLALLGLMVVFAVVGASVAEFLGLAVLSLIVLAVEALNTAIEELVDNASPGWSEFAKNAKDMGSFAVMCMLVATGLYAAWVVFL
ncbi:diacylglycerol kinase [Tabrizicola sp.]|uniref:diacylglycerol kinase n=1 Tax=Tabrizicola sp. TaxID=2005166 RepID=UPI00286C0036|nr:diacylglycerol kinase [Tabrizicola sp.]